MALNAEHRYDFEGKKCWINEIDLSIWFQWCFWVDDWKIMKGKLTYGKKIASWFRDKLVKIIKKCW